MSHELEYVTVLSPEAWDEFQRIINDPAPPNENLIRAAQAYRDDVIAGRLKSEHTTPT